MAFAQHLFRPGSASFQISLWKLFSLPYLRKTVKNFPEKPFVSYLRMKRNFCELIFPWKCPWPIPQRNFFSTKILSNIN